MTTSTALSLRAIGTSLVICAAGLVMLWLLFAPARVVGNSLLNANSSNSIGVTTFTETPRPSTSPSPSASAPTSTPAPSVTGISSPTSISSRTPICASAWSIVSSPNVGFAGNQLLGLATVVGSDVWAVGYYTSSTGFEHTLIEHWDGTRWSIIASPDVESVNNRLEAISALSADDIWAVGYYAASTTATDSATSIVPEANTPSTKRALGSIPSPDSLAVSPEGTLPDFSDATTLVLHWDGTNWNQVVSARLGGVLYAVDAISSDDVWAVGATAYIQTEQTLALAIHWDGKSWTVVPCPPGDPDYNVLDAVAGTASNDVWAAGYYNASLQLWVQHWDGQQWNFVEVPQPCCSHNQFHGAAVLGSNDIWLVGNGSWQVQFALGYHSDGSTWTQFFLAPSTDYNRFYGVAAVASNDVWAVGVTFPYGMLIAHWDGAAWQPIASPPEPQYTSLYSVSAVGANDVWAAGYSGNDYNEVGRTALLHFVGPSGLCPTATPSPTPVSCPIQFSDVHPGDPFYSYIMCLACQGIVSGYPDGTFRSGASVTRGQVSKIIANAARYSDPIPSTQQSFSDVSPSQTFWLYIERAYAHGILQGYPCGGSGEPCDPYNRPYFRPGVQVTRGQTTKVVANTFDPGCQTR